MKRYFDLRPPYRVRLFANRAAMPSRCFRARSVSVFSSSDAGLERAYSWAQDMALSYVCTTAAIGPVYDKAARPQREAFCVRDVSHQSVRSILGLAAPKAISGRFAANTHKRSKDWWS